MAMTLADVRAKYPQYKDVDDKALADALYAKYYSTADRREFDARVGLKPYDDFLTGVAKGAQNIIPATEQSLAGMSQMAGEFLTDAANRELPTPVPGNPMASLISAPTDVAGAVIGLLPEDTRKDLAYQGAVQSLRGQLHAQAAEKNMATVDAPILSAPAIASTVVTSTAQMLPAIAASVLLKNPTPALAAAGMQGGGTAYRTGRQDQIDWEKGFLDEATKAGLAPEQARQYAGLYAAAEAIPEMIPLGVLLKEGGSLIPRVIKGAATEGVSEGITSLAQQAVDKGYVNPDLTWEQAWPQIVQAMAAGTIMGGVFGGVAQGVHKAGEKPPEPVPTQPVIEQPVNDTPIEDQLALPAPQTLLALPSPEQFKDPVIARRQPQLDGGLPAAMAQPAAQVQDERDYQARVALQKTKQTETAALLQTARETITPLGTFTPDEIGPEAAGKVRARRVQQGRPVEAPVTVAELAAAKVPQKQIDAIISTRRPLTSEVALTPLDIKRSADAKNLIADDGNFAELALRTTGQRNVERMTQAQLGALKSVLDAMPVHETPVTVPVADAPVFTEEHYNKALDALRKDGRYTAAAIKQATGLKSNSDVAAIREALVRRGQLVQRGKNDFRLYDVIGKERQTTPADLPPGAFSEFVTRRIPVEKVRIRQDGESVATFGSATEARGRVRDIRAAEEQAGGKSSAIAIEPAGDTAWGVIENRYDEAGNLLGQAVVSTHKDETAAQQEAGRMSTPDTGARYTQTPVETPAKPAPAPVRQIAPAALEGRLPEVLKRLNQQAKDRRLPLLGVRVQVKPRVNVEGADVEGVYWRKLIQLTAQNLTPEMSTDEVVEKLAQVMDHETIHALRAAGVLGPETEGWKAIVRYARRAKRPGESSTFLEWAKRAYAGIPGYETQDSIEEEAIAEAFRAWAANKRNVVGQPATVFRQLVEWFKRLLNAIPEDAFSAIETGRLVDEALRPPGSSQPRARATTKMQEATTGAATAQQAGNEEEVRARSREYLKARAQSREDRYGRSGPKTVIGTTPTSAYETGDIADRTQVGAIVEDYRKKAGVDGSRLQTYLPEDAAYLKRVADAQQRGVHAPASDAVAKAYRALIDETKAMWRALGDIQVTPWAGDGQPYASPAEMLADIAAGRLKMRLSNDMFGPGADNPGHPMNAASGIKATDGRDLTINDLFRVVHDIYGHGQSGFRDNPRGAYNAYHEHARLVSKQALPALATETLAQRAWQDYGAHMRRKDGSVPRETDVDYLPPAKREFAEQKAFLLDPALLEADPGWAVAERAAEAEDDAPKFSRFKDDLPGGRLYGNPNRSPGGALSKPDTPTPAFSSERPGNRFFGGELAEEQLRMAREGVDGATMVYLPPEAFLSLANQEPNPEQAVYDDAVAAGYKLSGMPSLVTDGYAGTVRVVDSDGMAGVRALAGAQGESIPVVIYPKGGKSFGLVTALEGPRETVLMPERAEFDPAERIDGAPRYSLNAPLGQRVPSDDNTTMPWTPEFKRWFGDSKVVDAEGKPLVVYHHGSFDEAEDVPGGAMHFGTKAAAEERSLGKRVDDAAMQVTAYQNDAGEWHWDDGSGYTSEDAGHSGGYSSEDTAIISGRADVVRQFENDEFSPEDSGKITAAYLSLKNPKYMTDQGSDWTAAIEQAKAEGHDGIVYRNLFEDKGQRSYIAFGPTQIKSVYNRGTFDPKDERIRYSLRAKEVFDLYAPYTGKVHDPLDPLHDPEAPIDPTGLDPDTFNIVHQRVETFFGKFLHAIGRSKTRIPLINTSIFELRVKYIDEKMLSVKEMMEAAKANHGIITRLNDAWVAEMLYHGKVFDEIRQREDTLYLDAMNSIRDHMQAVGNRPAVTFEDIGSYLYAMHAPERNAYLRAKGSNEENPSGMSDAEARSILDQLAIDGKLQSLEEVAAVIRKIIEDTNQTRLKNGLISQDVYDHPWAQYYVPLRGLATDETTLADIEKVGAGRGRGRGKGFSVRGTNDPKMRGRERKAAAEDILGHIFLQNTETVIRAEKNNVAKAFIRFIMDNPALNYGRVVKGRPPKLPEGQNVVAKVQGKDVVAIDVPVPIARAINSDYPSTSNTFVRGLGRINRYLAAIHTAFSPLFQIRGLARDATTAAIMASQYDIPNFSGLVLRDAPKAAAGIREVLRKGTAEGQWAKAFRELQSLGGTSEYLSIIDLEQQQKRILKNVINSKNNPTLRQARDLWDATLKLMNDYGKMAENSYRVSAYVNARRAGVSPEHAAVIAKRITVNFTQGSENKTTMNALYLFYNANTGGSAGMLRGLKNRRVQIICGTLVVVGAAMDMILRATSDDDDENGVLDYDEIMPWLKQTNWVVPNFFGGKNKYMLLPMPYGFNIFTAMGRNISSVLAGTKSIPEAAMDQAVTTLEAFNPVGGLISVLNFLSPTALTPVVDLETNKNFAGVPIVPERPNYMGGDQPRSQQYYSTVNPVAREVAKYLNELGGGSEVRSSGWLDWSPESMEHVFDFITPDIVKLGAEGATTTLDIVRGQWGDKGMTDLPLVRKFLTPADNRANQALFYKNANAVQTSANEFDLFARQGNHARLEHLEKSRAADIAFGVPRRYGNKTKPSVLSQVQAVLSDLRKSRETAMAANDQETVKAIDEQINAEMASFNRNYLEAKKPPAQ